MVMWCDTVSAEKSHNKSTRHHQIRGPDWFHPFVNSCFRAEQTDLYITSCYRKPPRVPLTSSGSLFSGNLLLVSCASAFDLMSLAENGLKTRDTHCGAWGEIRVHDDRVAESHLSDSAWTGGGFSTLCVRVWQGGRALCVHGDVPNNSYNLWTQAVVGRDLLVNIRPGLWGLHWPVSLNSHLPRTDEGMNKRRTLKVDFPNETSHKTNKISSNFKSSSS